MKGRGDEGEKWEGDSFGPRSGPGPHTFLRIYAGMRVNKSCWKNAELALVRIHYRAYTPSIIKNFINFYHISRKLSEF